MDEASSTAIHTMCRICLLTLQDSPAYDLFLIPGLAKKFCVCTSLNVEQQDGFPRNLCGDCHEKLNNLHDFQKQCVDSVEKFKEMALHCCQTSKFDVLNVSGGQDAADTAIEEEDRINFDPLLSTKTETIEGEQDVFKMIEDVDKDAEEDAVDEAVEDQSNSGEEEELQCSDSDDSMPLSRFITSTKKPKSKSEKNNFVNDNSSSKSEESDADDVDISSSKKRSIAESNRNTFNCHICGQKFKKASRFEDHMKHHNNELPFQCPVETCKKGFTTSAGLRHHVDHTHSELCELHPCIIEGCNNKFPRIRMLKHHLRKFHQIAQPEIRSHACPECDKVFRCPSALKKHMYKHTGEELPICCNICNKRFHINSELRDHLLRHAGVKNHVCPYCGVGKTTRQEWNKHILTHTREKQFQCPQCDHASHNKQALTNHINVIHKEIRRYSCQYCGKMFGKSHACKIHEKLHTGEDCPECKICGKKFLFEKSLTKHLQTHEKRNESKTIEAVEVDDQSGSQDKVKKSHRVKVVDMSQLAGTSVNPIPSVSVPSWSPQVNFTKKEGQHICPGCGKGFNHIGNMKLHYKVVHQKIKDFACRYCPKRFGKSQYLQQHENTHTGERPFACKICDKCFSHGSSLRKHTLSHEKPPRLPKKPKTEKKLGEMSYHKASQGPKIELNKEPTKNYEQYQDPAVERAAATAELIAQQLMESEAKRKAEEKTREIQEAASELLQKLEQAQAVEKRQYNRNI